MKKYNFIPSLLIISIIAIFLPVVFPAKAVTRVMVPEGGTGQTDFESGAFLIGNGSGAIATTTLSGAETDPIWLSEKSLYYKFTDFAASQLGQIGDVATTTLAASYMLYYDGSNWTSTSTLAINTTTGLVDILNGLTVQGAFITGSTDTDSLLISDLSGVSAGNFLAVDANGNVIATTTPSTGDGTVTSVAMTVPTGLSISGSPITTSGTLGLTVTGGYEIPSTASTSNWNTFYDTPSNRITAGTNLAWSGNTLNATDTNTTYTAGTNLTLTDTTFNVDDAFLVNNASDTTAGSITALGFRVGDGGEVGTALSFWTFDNTNTDITTSLAKVGIGTTTPRADLHVAGNVLISLDADNLGSMKIEDYEYGITYLEIDTDSSVFTMGEQGGGGSDVNLVLDTGLDKAYFSAGKIGISTTSPMAKLSVNSSSVPQLVLAYDTGGYASFSINASDTLQIDTTGDALRFGDVAGDTRLYFDGQFLLGGKENATSTFDGQVQFNDLSGEWGCYFIYAATTTLDCF